MTTQVIGEVNWDTVGAKSTKSEGKDAWMRLEDGINTVRIVTNPHQYLVHKSVKPVGDKGFGQKVFCSIDNCPLCKMGHQASTRWYVGVIDRKTNSYKVLDVGGSVVYKLKSLNQNPRWNDPKRYDIDIVKNSKADPQHYYDVQTTPPTPLSAADQKIIDEADLDELKRKTKAPSPEQVQQRMDKILNGQPLFIPPAVEKAKSSAMKKLTTMAVEVDTDDGDDLFPDHVAQAV